MAQKIIDTTTPQPGGKMGDTAKVAFGKVNDNFTELYNKTAGLQDALDGKLDESATAAAATKLATPRTINGTSFDGSANITTANWGTARTLTIGNTGKAFDGSANVSWSLADIGAVSQPDIGTAPNQVPLNQYLGTLAYQNAEAVTIKPQASATPAMAGEMVFQLTNDTTLVVKVKGSDGVVRSATLTLV